MFLTDFEILNSVKKYNLIENFNENNLGCISYDLTINNIIFPNTKQEQNKYVLKPNETVFVSTKENINLSNNFIAVTTPRNSCIRMGLSVAAPVYHPGHHTKVFIRVTNISNNNILLKSQMSIVSIMFCQLSTNVLNPYNGVFADEFNYKGIGDFHAVETAKINKADNSQNKNH